MKVEKFKSLIKESIKEVLVEEGLLKEVISAVIEETQQASVVSRQDDGALSAPNLQETISRNTQKLESMRQKMMESIGKSSYSDLYNLEGLDLFEGTSPLSKGGTPGQNPASQGALSGVDPNDAGVSIDSLLGNKKLWQQLMDKK